MTTCGRRSSCAPARTRRCRSTSRDIVGLWEDGGERDVPDGYHKDFGVALCRAGFAVAAPEISGFGERQTDFSYLARGQGAPSTCAHVPGLAEFGEMHDLAGLVAPRPMLVEAGTHDPIFPISAVRSGLARARKVYGVFGAGGQVKADIFSGRHQISGARAYDFLGAALA